MNRPHITCYMMNSLDGKIIGDYFDTERGTEFITKYEQIHDKLDAKAWMNGRVTLQGWDYQLTPGNKLELPKNAPHIERTDYIAGVETKKYAVVIDGSGKLAWNTNRILHGASAAYPARVGDHIVSVLTEAVSDAYLAYLRELKISYIFGGKDTLDFDLVLDKLYNTFGIDSLLLEGGGHLNGSFVQKDLIDEYCVLVMATVNGGVPGVAPLTSFEASPGQGKFIPVDFYVKEIVKINNTGLLLTFTRKNEEVR